jgi:hypothetical protein
MMVDGRRQPTSGETAVEDAVVSLFCAGQQWMRSVMVIIPGEALSKNEILNC